MEVVLNILCFRSGTDPELLTQILLSLTNLAVLPDWHHHLPPLHYEPACEAHGLEALRTQSSLGHLVG